MSDGYVSTSEADLRRLLGEVQHLRVQVGELQEKNTELVLQNRVLKQAVGINPAKITWVHRDGHLFHTVSRNHKLTDDRVFVCRICGGTSQDIQGENSPHWTPSCVSGAMIADKKDLQFDREGRVIAVLPRGET